MQRLCWLISLSFVAFSVLTVDSLPKGALRHGRKEKYSRNASQELSVPWAETPQGQWSQNPVSVLTGTSLNGESLYVSSPVPWDTDWFGG